jgi:hypothetical protein
MTPPPPGVLLLEDQASGLLVPPRDPDALATTMIRLIESPELARSRR